MTLARDQNKSLRELLDSMSVREIALWLSFYKENPPEYSANYRAATISAAVYNASGNLKSGTTAKPDDFMPAKPEEVKELTPEMLKSIFQQVQE